MVGTASRSRACHGDAAGRVAFSSTRIRDGGHECWPLAAETVYGVRRHRMNRLNHSWVHLELDGQTSISQAMLATMVQLVVTLQRPNPRSWRRMAAISPHSLLASLSFSPWPLAPGPWPLAPGPGLLSGPASDKLAPGPTGATSPTGPLLLRDHEA